MREDDELRERKQDKTSRRGEVAGNSLGISPPVDLALSLSAHARNCKMIGDVVTIKNFMLFLFAVFCDVFS